MTQTTTREYVLNRLMGNIEVNDKCLIHRNKNTNSQGYGTTSVGKRAYRLHRVLWWIYNKEYDKPSDIPPTLHIRHLCPNKLCLNINHYKSGNAFDNAADKLIAGTQMFGEKHHTAVITFLQAQAIADSWKSGKSMNQRAKDFNVTIGVVSAIDKRHTWQDIKHPNGKSYIGLRDKNRQQRSRARERFTQITDYSKVITGILARSMECEQPNKFMSTPCREWKKPFSKYYPRVSFFGHTQDAHVWALQAKLCRPINKDTPITRHLCGNRFCVRFDHLEEGTHQQNSHDRQLHRSKQESH